MPNFAIDAGKDASITIPCRTKKVGNLKKFAGRQRIPESK